MAKDILREDRGIRLVPLFKDNWGCLPIAAMLGVSIFGVWSCNASEAEQDNANAATATAWAKENGTPTPTLTLAPTPTETLTPTPKELFFNESVIEIIKSGDGNAATVIIHANHWERNVFTEFPESIFTFAVIDGFPLVIEISGKFYDVDRATFICFEDSETIERQDNNTKITINDVVSIDEDRVFFIQKNGSIKSLDNVRLVTLNTNKSQMLITFADGRTVVNDLMKSKANLGGIIILRPNTVGQGE